MKQIEVTVSYYLGFGHSGGRYSERTRTKQVANQVAEQLQSLLDAKKAAQKKPLELTNRDIEQAIADGADVLLSLHNDLLKSDTSTGYVITKVTTAPKKIETIQFEKEYTIPRKVRAIQDFAFRRNTEVETIFIHSKIEKIGIEAYLDCKNLSAIIVDEENPYFCSEDGILYNKDKTCLIQFPAGMTTIEPHTFSCSKLTSVVIPSNIRTIRESAFVFSSHLSEVTLSEGLVRIEKNAFVNCKIDEIVLPQSAKQAFKRAFDRHVNIISK